MNCKHGKINCISEKCDACICDNFTATEYIPSDNKSVLLRDIVSIIEGMRIAIDCSFPMNKEDVVNQNLNLMYNRAIQNVLTELRKL